MSINNTTPKNFDIKDPAKQEYTNQEKIRTITNHINNICVVEIPITATSFAKALKVSYLVQGSSSEIRMTTVFDPAASYSNPITYYVDLGDDFNYELETIFRQNWGTEKLLEYTEGEYNPITQSFPVQLYQCIRFTVNCRPFTRICLFTGYIPPNNPGAGDPWIFTTFYNRFDGLIHSNQIPALSGPTAVDPALAPIGCSDRWFFFISFSPKTPSNFFIGFNGPDIGLYDIPYNDTPAGLTPWKDLPPTKF